MKLSNKRARLKGEGVGEDRKMWDKYVYHSLIYNEYV